MTPAEQKAREIAEEWCLGEFTDTKYEEFQKMLAQALTEFAREAILDDREKRTADDLYRLSRESGAMSMRERAAKAAEEVWKKADNTPPHFHQNSVSFGCIESAKAIRSLPLVEGEK